MVRRMTARVQAKILERDVLKAVSDLLSAHGFRVYRRNTGAMTASHNGKTRFVRFSQPGMADLWGWQIGSGRHFECEVKAPGEKPTPGQLLWLELAQSGGVLAFWADSVEMAKQKLAKLWEK